MQPMYYIGLDVHKQKISYCVKDSSGKIYAEGWIPALEAKLLGNGFDTGPIDKFSFNLLATLVTTDSAVPAVPSERDGPG